MKKLVYLLCIALSFGLISSTQKSKKPFYHMSSFFFEDIYGNIKKIEEFKYQILEEDSVTEYKYLYEFNQKGELIKEFQIWSGEILANDCFIKSGNTLIQQQCSDTSTIVAVKEIYFLDNMNRIEKHTTEEEQVFTTYKAEYNEKNAITRFYIEGKNKVNMEWELDYFMQIKYELDKNSKVIKSITTMDDGDPDESIFTRNSDGLLLESDQGIVDLSKYSNHDSHGNWLKSKCLQNGNSYLVIRNIEYWD